MRMCVHSCVLYNCEYIHACHGVPVETIIFFHHYDWTHAVRFMAKASLPVVPSHSSLSFPLNGPSSVFWSLTQTLCPVGLLSTGLCISELPQSQGL